MFAISLIVIMIGAVMLAIALLAWLNGDRVAASWVTATLSSLTIGMLLMAEGAHWRTLGGILLALGVVIASFAAEREPRPPVSPYFWVLPIALVLIGMKLI